MCSTSAAAVRYRVMSTIAGGASGLAHFQQVVVVGRDPVRLDAAGRVLDKWAATPAESVGMAHDEAAAELAAINTAIATSGWAALEAYGRLNPAIQRASVLAAACTGSRKSRAAITSGRTWRSTRVPECISAGRGANDCR